MTKISVIVLVLNQDGVSKACIESLVRQTMSPSEYEIIVTGYTHTDWLDEYRKPYTSHSILVNKSTGQVVADLNNAVTIAKGEYCLFIASQMRADSSLLSEHIQAQQASGGVIGLGINQIPEASVEKRKDLEHAVSWLDCTLGNLSLPRERLLEVGSFCPELSKSYDIELAYRLNQLGLPVQRIDSAITILDSTPSQRNLMQQEIDYGAVCVELWRKHPPLLSQLLGNFQATSRRGVLLLRILIALAVSPYWMVILRPLISNPSWGNKYDEFFHQFCFWRGVRTAVDDRKVWHQLTYAVPILMYHAFCTNNERASRYIQPIQKFKIQMRLLKLLGYRVIHLHQYLECLREGNLPEDRSIIITIDDGYLDNFTLAYPVLKHLGIPTTIFLVSNYLGKVNDWDKDSALTGRQVLTAEDARQMQGELVTFGAHTHTHPWLRSISVEQARDEIATSKKVLEQELKSPVQLFAYPHGEYDDVLVKLLEQAGFLGACTTKVGLNTPGNSRFTLHRNEIYGTFSIFKFLIAIRSRNNEYRALKK